MLCRKLLKSPRVGDLWRQSYTGTFQTPQLLSSNGYFPAASVTRSKVGALRPLVSTSVTTPATSIFKLTGSGKPSGIIHPAYSFAHFSTTARGLAISAKDAKREEELRNKKLEAHTETVSTTSGMTPIFGEEAGGTPAREGNEHNVSGGLASDIRTIRDTFRLEDVPREVLYIGMAGLIPYVATSMSTLYLAWDINFAHENGYGYLISPENAHNLLQVLEPLQVGYGAVIISFLSAIHWGLEFAGYGGRKSMRRYAIGLLGPVLGWSTLLLPLHEAFLGQFAGFTALYFFDTSATTAGLAPSWYGTYRFVLTFVVGASILVTLIGRGKIGDRAEHVPRPTEKLQKIREQQRSEVQKENQGQLDKIKSQSANSPSQTGQKEGVKPGDENEAIRKEMQSKPGARPVVNQGPEPSSEKKNNIKPKA